jgi:hypothetical protein
MPVGHARYLDKWIPATKRDRCCFCWGWKGLVLRTANMAMPPAPGRPVYGQAARDEITRLYRWARRIQVRIGRRSERHFRQVRRSERPLNYATWRSTRDYLARREREREVAVAAGRPWPPTDRPKASVGPRITASTPTSARPAAAPIGLRITPPGAGQAKIALTPPGPPPTAHRPGPWVRGARRVL